jgi:Tfp pilus assembly protein PilO
MTNWFDKLNLRPGERRLLVLIGIAFFVVLNILFVKPHFGAVGRLRKQLDQQETTRDRYQREIARTRDYEKRIKELELQGQTVPSTEMGLEFQKTVQRQAAASSLSILSTDARAGGAQNQTSEFFEEQILRVTATGNDKQLVDFLHRIGTGDSLIRVRELSVSPDPGGMRLNSVITLVASYQRAAKPAAKPAPKPVATAQTP